VAWKKFVLFNQGGSPESFENDGVWPGEHPSQVCSGNKRYIRTFLGDFINFISLISGKY
jgi:hypothetical protein